MQQRRFELLSVSDLSRLPEPEWLIEGLFEQEAQVVLFGPPEKGKTFLALDWALCIATGKPWQQRAVARGPVLYVLTEGLRGMKRRIKAWEQAFATQAPPDFFFLRGDPQLKVAGDVEAVLAVANSRNLHPKLVVLDTLAKTFVGGEENSAKEMGEWLAGAARLQRETGASVLIVHHTTRPKGNNSKKAQERGSSSLRGAVDTMATLQEAAGVLTLSCEKQKDHEHFAPVFLRREGVQLGSGATSAVLLDAAAPELLATRGPSLVALEALVAMPSQRASSSDWMAATLRNGKPVAETTFHRYRRALLDEGLVRQLPDGTYEVVEQTATATEVPLDCHGKAA